MDFSGRRGTAWWRSRAVEARRRVREATGAGGDRSAACTSSGWASVGRLQTGFAGRKEWASGPDPSPDWGADLKIHPPPAPPWAARALAGSDLPHPRWRCAREVRPGEEEELLAMRARASRGKVVPDFWAVRGTREGWLKLGQTRSASKPRAGDCDLGRSYRSGLGRADRAGGSASVDRLPTSW